MKQSLVAVSFFLCASSITLEAEPVRPLDVETDKVVWVSIGKDASNLLEKQQPELVRIPQAQKTLLKQNKVAVVSIKESQLHVLSEFMHENFKRCGGYFHHKSYEEAISFANKSADLKTKSVVNYTIDNGEVVNSLLAKIVPSNMASTVTSMGNYNNRFYTQQSGVDAANWLKEQWQSMASSRGDISVELYNHSNWSQPSVIATITGSTNSNEFVVIGGHLDSINGMGGATARAPGYDDNASGIAVITETLNAIVASDFRPERTLLLMGYAAEEVGLRGSAEIAQAYKSQGKNVVGVAQFDMTGYHGTSDKNIVFMNDYTNEAQNQFMAQLIDTYLPGVTYAYDPCGYACSDHASWHSQGFAASFPFESYSRDYNSRIHTTGDDTFDANHATNFLKLSVAYAGELAKGSIGEPVTSAGQVSLVATSAEVEEGRSISVEISRSGGSASAVSIDYATQDDSAVAGTHYTATSGTLNWADGESGTKTVVIATAETDADKAFTLNLANPQGGAAIGGNQSINITIKNKSTTNPPPAPQTSSGGGAAWSVSFFCIALLLRRLGRKQY